MLEFLFSFLLNYQPTLAVFIFSIIILFVINIFYKILINQNDAKQIKNRTKELNSEMKAAQKAKDMDKANRLMKEMLSENQKMMRMTMKPMMVSLIVVVVLLPSAATFYGDKFVEMKDGQGELKLFTQTYAVEKTNDLVKIGESSCTQPCTLKIDNYDYKVSMQEDNVKVAQIVATLPFPLPFVGDTFGWLGWYIICSIPLVILMRKFMKIYM